MSKVCWIPAVGYLRRSTKKQEASIPEQRKEVEKYAADHGYKIIRWYVDDAIRGHDTKNRLDFLRMVEDAKTGDFRAILCWDQKRFSRADSLETNYYAHQLRQAGVYLDTVTGGKVDWNSFGGRVINSVEQELSHKDSADLSQNVLRGQVESMEAGGWIGSPPYAYRTEGPRKLRRLVVDNPAHARVVKRIFREFDAGRSLMDIARRLTADGIKSPTGNNQPSTTDLSRAARRGIEPISSP